MNIEKILDKIHAFVIGNTWLQLFTVFTRLILAIGFIPPSIKKILGERFTFLPDSNPVGHYFNALYDTGFYYQFIGWAQLIAALLLLFPRTAHLGAVAFFPIILNIAVLTSSVGFVGTNYLTALMLLASTYLVFWEYDRLKPLFFPRKESKVHLPKLEFLWLPCLFALGGALVALIFIYGQVANLQRNALPTLIMMTVGGLVFGLACSIHHRFMSIKSLENPADSV